jgi:hypothetical protein
MRSKAEVCQEHFGTQDRSAASTIHMTSLQDAHKNPLAIPLSSWTKMELPYEAPIHPELPTMDQIDKALTENRISHKYGQHVVVRVGNCVVKVSKDPIVLQEAEDQLFLEQNSQVRTAKLYAAFTCRTEKYGLGFYVVTEFLEGDTLSYEKWVSWGADAQAKIIASISEQLRLLRSVPAEGYYGRVNRQGWRPGLYLLRTLFKEICGPYHTYEDLVSAIYTSAELTGTICCGSKDWVGSQEACLAAIKSTLTGCKGSQPTLTHLDPAGKNIIIRRVEGTDGEDEVWEATFIDWADCGWYPAWMQTVAFHTQGYMDGEGDMTEQEETKALREMERWRNSVLQGFEDPYEEQVSLFKETDDVLAFSVM